MMGTLEILERLKLFMEDWAVEFNRTCGKPQGEAYRLSKKAYFDFKSIKVQIEKSLDEMADELVGARYEIQSLRDKLSDARLEARFNDTNE